jgi:transposase
MVRSITGALLAAGRDFRCGDTRLILDPEDEILAGMGRKRTQLWLTAADRMELAQRLPTMTDARLKERLRFALLAAEGRHTLEELAERLGRARSTLQLWLDKFNAGGLAELLQRESPPGLLSPLGGAGVQAELAAGLQAGRWASAQQIAHWLHEAHGIQRARKSIYYWLKRQGWSAPGAKSGPVLGQAASAGCHRSHAAALPAKALV